MNKTILLKNRPIGTPQLSDFEIIADKIPEVTDGKVLIKNMFVSVDPYLRGRMRGEKSYISSFNLGEPLSSGCIAEVVESRSQHFKKGDFVTGMLKWKVYQLIDEKKLSKLPKTDLPLSAHLGVLGMTGLTAYFGLTEIGKPKKGDTLVVSGAAGAVGSVVGQIGKVLGCHAIGIAGSDEKTEQLKSKYGFDGAINYKTTKDIAEEVAALCPNGVDIYFDNVGGAISDGVHKNINKFSRIVVCGAISTYNSTTPITGPRVEGLLISKSALMQGFIVRDFVDKFPEGIRYLSTLLHEGKLTYTETIAEGFDTIPQAFINLFEGKNKGKMIVKV